MTRRNILLLCLWMTAMVSQAALTVTELKVEGLRSPLGIDTQTPRFSWQLESDQRNVVQTAYEIVVCAADGTLMWNSGRVESPVPYGIKYEGTPLKSCSAYTWTVKVTTTDGTADASSTFETAFMKPSEWTGQWIHAEVSQQTLDAMSIVFDTPVQCRYVRLDVTELGLRASTDAGFSFVQLAEMEV
ncbi:MAG: glycogen debranching protein, partial [Bacteroidales bacterium]|nr:glycogen debranching protein [Bacteroidales bacterium]